MTAEQAITRLSNAASAWATTEQRAAFLFVLLSILGTEEPQVLEYILDRADERLEAGLL